MLLKFEIVLNDDPYLETVSLNGVQIGIIKSTDKGFKYLPMGKTKGSRTYGSPEELKSLITTENDRAAAQKTKPRLY